MEFLYLLEKIRMPGLNELMLAVTTLGEETAFLVIGLIIFWCVDKRKGYYVMAVGFAGTMANQIMKLACRVPRPWVLDTNFSILEQARSVKRMSMNAAALFILYLLIGTLALNLVEDNLAHTH